LNREIGLDAAVTSQRMSRREPSDISERLRFIGWHVARRGGAGGPGRSVELMWVDDGAIQDIHDGWIDKNQ